MNIIQNYLSDPQEADFYGDHGNIGFGRIGLGEAWGHFIGNRFALEMYGYTRLSNTPWGLLPFFQENNERPVPDLLDPNDNDTWIPYGVFHDLIDSKNTGFWNLNSPNSNEDFLNVDKIGGFGGSLNPNGNDLSKLYIPLGPSISNPTEYKAAFMQLYVTPSSTTDYNALWDWYGY